MARIGILSCSNCTQETDCCMSACLGDLRKRRGFFDRYPADETLDLVGVISCAGCPTLAAPEKILRKVDAIASFRVDALHMTYCMTAICPFRKAYRRVISEVYPDLEIVEGTHTPVDPGEFRRGMAELLCPTLTRKPAMVDMVNGRLEVPGEPLKFH